MVDSSVTRDQAIRFIRYHGVVLESARGNEPSLAERIAGGPVRRSWWGHPKGHEIFDITRMVRASPAVLVCSLANGKVTYVHRRLWPYFVRLAGEFPPGALDQIRERHLASGRHERKDVAFPEWVPSATTRSAACLAEAEAKRKIEPWLSRYGGWPNHSA